MQESSLAPRPRYEADGIVLRTLTTNAEYDEAVALQDEIWGAGFTEWRQLARSLPRSRRGRA